MGSIDEARITGFLCRLCNAMSRVVIHIYGDRGRRMNLEEKLIEHMSVVVSPTDALPKTICLKCLASVESHCGLEKSLSVLNKILSRLEVNPMLNLDGISELDEDSDDYSDLYTSSDEDESFDEETE